MEDPVLGQIAHEMGRQTADLLLPRLRQAWDAGRAYERKRILQVVSTEDGAPVAPAPLVEPEQPADTSEAKPLRAPRGAADDVILAALRNRPGATEKQIAEWGTANGMTVPNVKTIENKLRIWRRDERVAQVNGGWHLTSKATAASPSGEGANIN